MNGIEKITGRIQEDTKIEIDRILSAARAEAAQIAERGRAQAEAEKSALTDRNEKAAAEREAGDGGKSLCAGTGEAVCHA